jgi:hypothetical protein
MGINSETQLLAVYVVQHLLNLLHGRAVDVSGAGMTRVITVYKTHD